MIKKIKTTPYLDQHFGTSGLRKKVKTFQKENYLENFIQSACLGLDSKGKSFVVGGDGRYFNDQAIHSAIKILVANEAKTIYVGLNGLFSTPAISLFIKRKQLDYGFIFSASHNPAGENGDFGFKINSSSGSGISEKIGNNISKIASTLTEYYTLEEDHSIEINLFTIKTYNILKTQIIMVDSVDFYADCMEDIFDFNKIASLFNGTHMVLKDFHMYYEAFHAVTGLYAKEIFHRRLGVPLSCLNNIENLSDFGGLHADPNVYMATKYLDNNRKKKFFDIFFASDGDGDRNLIAGVNNVVSPSDSLAVITYYSKIVSFYKHIVTGVARSFPTTRAVDLVAQEMNIDCFAVPTGWKFFDTLLLHNKITFCGEESYGTGSCHCGEKDGIWAMLFWLNIIAETGKTVDSLLFDLWTTFGRFYFVRLDYHDLSDKSVEQIYLNLLLLNQASLAEGQIRVSEFCYKDIITKEFYENKGTVVNIGNDLRVVMRSSGTSTSGKTLRVYIEKYENINIQAQKNDYLQSWIEFIINKVFDGIQPNLID